MSLAPSVSAIRLPIGLMSCSKRWAGSSNVAHVSQAPSSRRVILPSLYPTVELVKIVSTDRIQSEKASMIARFGFSGIETR